MRDRARSSWAPSEAEVRSVCPSVTRSVPASQRASGPGARLRAAGNGRPRRVEVRLKLATGPAKAGHYVLVLRRIAREVDIAFASL